MSSVPLKTATARGGRAAVIVLALALLALLVAAPAALAKGGMGANVQIKLADEVITAGDESVITVSVRPAVVGTTVTLWRCPAGGDWEVVATKAVAEPSGKVRFTDYPTRHTLYRAKWNWDAARWLWSRIAWQKVRAQLTIKAEVAAYQYGTGTPVTISGTLVPAWNGHTVRISVARWEGDCLVPVASLAAPLTPGPGDSSLYSVTWNALKSGDYVIRAQVKRAPHFFGAWVATEFSL